MGISHVSLLLWTKWRIIAVHMEQAFETLIWFLGGADVLGSRRLRNELDLDSLTHEGIPVASLEHAIAMLGSTKQSILDGVGIARSTMRRRKSGGGLRLDLVESERTIRLGRIAALGNEALGSMNAVGHWLQESNRALGGAEPLSLLQTDAGTREVEAVLTRALYGGYS